MCGSIFTLIYPPPGIPRVGPKWHVKASLLGTYDQVNALGSGQILVVNYPRSGEISRCENPTLRAFLYEKSGEIPTLKTSPEVNFEWNVSEIPTLGAFHDSETLLIWQSIRIKNTRFFYKKPFYKKQAHMMSDFGDF